MPRPSSAAQAAGEGTSVWVGSHAQHVFNVHTVGSDEYHTVGLFVWKGACS